MEQSIYQLSLIVTGILNIIMGLYLLLGNYRYKKYPIYYMARICTTIWVLAFGIGYQLHTLFPNDSLPFMLLLFAGVGMFSYMVYSIENYGKVIDPATRATLDVSMQRQKRKKV